MDMLLVDGGGVTEEGRNSRKLRARCAGEGTIGEEEQWTNLFGDFLLLVSRECSELVELCADEKGYCGLCADNNS